MAKAHKRGPCRCQPGQEYCGTCDICGKPGHVRHYPGPVPLTGCWCDEHYDQIEMDGMFGGPIPDIRPDRYFEVLTPENAPKLYIACQSDRVVVMVTVKRNKRKTKHIYYEADGDIDDTPLSEWDVELQPITEADFNLLCFGRH